jgi:hypothetical protein
MRQRKKANTAARSERTKKRGSPRIITSTQPGIPTSQWGEALKFMKSVLPDFISVVS